MTQPQLDITFARKARDKGIAKASQSAEEVSPGWNVRLYELFKEFLCGRKTEFLAEDFRVSVIGKIDLPRSNRSFGGLFMKAARQGIIRRVGYAPVKNWKAHRCMASVWKRT